MSQFNACVVFDIVSFYDIQSNSAGQALKIIDMELGDFNDIFEIILVNRNGKTLKLEAYELNYKIESLE